MKHLSFALIATGALALTGCNMGPSVVGTWTRSHSMGGLQAATTLEIKADKSFTEVTQLTLPGGGSATVNLNGTYAITDGNKIKFKPIDGTLDTSEPRLKQNEKRILDAFMGPMNATLPVEIVWVSNDEFHLTVNKNLQKYNRKK